MTSMAVLTLAPAAPATARTDPGTVWTGMPDRCRCEMARPALGSAIGRDRFWQDRNGIAPGRAPRAFRHRDIRARDEMDRDRAARQVIACGTLAAIRPEPTDFPPARMDIARRPPCQQAN